MKEFLLLLKILLLIFVCNCSPKKDQIKLFSKIPSSKSNIKFNNIIQPFENDTLNALEFDPLFNGGGIGVGDFNNDGLQDLFFSGNLVPSKLYINKGDFVFEDVTTISGLNNNKWCTGVSITDINNDGLTDLYISVAGIDTFSKNRVNLLYVNQGNNKNNIPVFKEMAAEYGLNDSGYNIQSAFFDYDHDGDLDCYILKNAYEKTGRNNIRPKRVNGEGLSTDKLYENTFQNGHPFFKDVSRKAGILKEGYGLGLCITDLNQDGWDDIYCANDFLSNDLIWINNHDGTFTDKAEEYFKHTSYNSMGVDVQDYNNDALPDVCVVDMLPEDNERRKMMVIKTNWDYFNLSRRKGYQDQYVRNVLQLNRGKDINGEPKFSEIGQLAGMYATDWSWAPLLADFDNDGYKDLVISNGYRRDITNLDYVVYLNQEAAQYGNTFLPEVRKKMLAELYKLPEVKVNNYIYKNKGDLTFENKSNEWGLEEKTFSNGAAYADLDNDGDLDLVFNNIDDEAGVYKNNLNEINKNGTDKAKNNNFINFHLKSNEKGNESIGAKIKITLPNGENLYQENFPIRGFMSSVDPILHFGFGKDKPEKVEITWANGKTEIIKNIKLNGINIINYNSKNQFFHPEEIKNIPLLFTKLDSNKTGLNYVHQEIIFDEFKRSALLPHIFSKNSPGIAIADVDNNGLDDIFIGSDPGYDRKLFLQNSPGKFTGKILGKNNLEDMGAIFFDADLDDDQDLYVVSGGSLIEGDNEIYQDRLYLNGGKGKLTRDQNALPPITSSGGVATAADFDKDGDIDVFRGGRVSVGNYPLSPNSYLLQNNGKGFFENSTKKFSNDLINVGMVTSALWSDVNNDSWLDLILVGECMPITIFKNINGKSFKKIENGLENQSGWWNSIASGDFDQDGDIDYIVGNLGLNTKFKASEKEPVSIYAGDFDNNNRIDPIVTYFLNGKEQVSATRDVMNDHMASWMRKKFTSYSSYSKASLNEILNEQERKKAKVFKMTQMQSCYIENLGGRKFKLKALPIETQFSSVYGIQIGDFNNDGLLDAILVGNSYSSETYTGWYDASIGTLLIGDGNGNFKPLNPLLSGIFADKDAKALAQVSTGKENILIVSNNNSGLQLFKQNFNSKKTIKLLPDDSFAIVILKNGKKQKTEFNYGSGYLSMSSRILSIPENAVSVSIYNFKGKERKIL